MKDKYTINDIAKLAGVSKTTVSFYLNGHFDKMSSDTRERIALIIAETGYQPNGLARSLSSRRTYMIGVIIGNITSLFAGEIVTSLNNYIQSHGYQLILGTTGFRTEDERRCLSSMYSMGVDGFVVQPSRGFEETWEKLEIDKPLVLLDSASPGTRHFSIKTNNHEAVYEAMDRVAGCGYTHFLLVSDDPAKITTREERVAGFTDYMLSHGLPYDVIHAAPETPEEDLRGELQSYIGDWPDLCIFTPSNWMLKKLFLALEPYRSLIPARIGLLGMDSYEWTSMTEPPISTIMQPTREEGLLTGQVIIKLIEGCPISQKSYMLSCRLNELASTGKSLSDPDKGRDNHIKDQ